MGNTATAILFVGALTSSVGTFTPRPVRWSSSDATARQATATSTHAVRGLLKLVSAGTLVIARGGRNAGDLTFVVTPATLRQGTLAAGTTVSVRYRVEGTALVAIAVTARETRAPR
jgi:hypothetical protein